MRRFRIFALLPLALLLSACNFVVLNPSGHVAAQERDLVVISTILMLIIIIPVMALTILFAWRYRHSNKSARYEPDWEHSTHLELVIWSAPLLIIICLGALTWMGTHLLDPYRAIGPGKSVHPSAGNAVPLDVEVVALDWKWLFIYPQYGVASLNELAAPVDRPINFRITSSSVMNSFYIPALAGQIYAMPGMQTKLHAIINEAGEYQGFSANYSGSGFSGMHFAFHGLDDAGFESWIGTLKASADQLGRGEYTALEQPSENVPVRRYGSVDADLFKAILNRCVTPGKMCMNDMMAIDAKGGLGLAGIPNLMPVSYDQFARSGAVLGPARSYVAAICTPEDSTAAGIAGPVTPALIGTTPILGSGLPLPSFMLNPRSTTSAIDPLPQPSNT
ncbi:ubiquinol oxidase subunit II [Kaistia dalseonensis]|uniref:Ubiquinol oxidase polypeptide II n=1 Tax=Kaistia dalseonensis TaxID=410840 RepID=A0ABU0HC82_9HYPH|nr:ubiquinol oxidase subunit II [Kaistia dalseonensis]MCX5496502.1 ubiquinol oxidase subunit II [Kaistia dalseonensis]MDQ0439124.1 cytochrome o ubiquinol oxidase subunit 2 [Kaistia dalseonensis]